MEIRTNGDPKKDSAKTMTQDRPGAARESDRVRAGSGDNGLAMPASFFKVNCSSTGRIFIF